MTGGWFTEETQFERDLHQLQVRNANRARRLAPAEVSSLLSSLNEREPETLRALLDELDDAEGSA